MSYFDFNNYIDKSKIKIIFELGSRDLIDARKLINYYQNSICYSFECNPDCILECKKNQKKFNQDENKRIKLIEKAVSIENKKIIFRPFDLSIYNNMGSSSILEIDFNNRNKKDPDYKRGKVQKEIEVEGIRLDSFMENNKIDNINLLCMDLQGYELEALKSLGNKIKNIKYIISECSIESTYKNGVNFKDLNSFLEENGFKYIKSNKFGESLPPENLGYLEFDSLFINILNV